MPEPSKKIGVMPLTEGTTGVDLVTLHPYFGEDGWYHDSEDHPSNEWANPTVDESRHTISPPTENVDLYSHSISRPRLHGRYRRFSPGSISFPIFSRF